MWYPGKERLHLGARNLTQMKNVKFVCEVGFVDQETAEEFLKYLLSFTQEGYVREQVFSAVLQGFWQMNVYYANDILVDENVVDRRGSQKPNSISPGAIVVFSNSVFTATV